MKKKKLYLFVWEGVLTDYTDGICFALAEDVEQARKLIKEKYWYVKDHDLETKPMQFDTPVGYALPGGG